MSEKNKEVVNGTQDTFYVLSDYVKNKLSPKTVLVIGFSMMYLVEKLRKENIEAYGISGFKNKTVSIDKNLSEFCKDLEFMSKFPKEMPKKYDLVIVLGTSQLCEELNQKDVFDKLCSLSERFLLSVDEALSNSELASALSEKSYYRDVFRTVPSEFAGAYAYFSKNDLDTKEICYNYECLIDEKSKKVCFLTKSNYEIGEENKALTIENDSLSKEVDELHFETDRLQYALEVAQKQIDEQSFKLKKLNDDVNRYKVAYLAIISSGFWNATQPIRNFFDSFKEFVKNFKLKKLLGVAVASVRNNGITKTAESYRHYALRDIAGKRYLKKNISSPEQLKTERNTKFEKNVKISILVPLYNTPINFLEEMVQSVIDQSYENWELCLADGSDDRHNEVGERVKQYVNQDKRIVYKKLEKNLGIAENTNECIKMVTGDYIALFDHDDILHLSALFEVVKQINDKNADFVYTDDTSFEGEITNPKFVHFKPDFSPDTLRSYNYICHLAVFSKELLDKVGMFSKNYDGSQDYDIILRLTEQAKMIVHIPRVLYYWRVHEASVAKDIEAKPYCIDSAKRAIKDHLKRLDINAEIEDSFIPTTYKVNYEIKGEPLISIVIPNKDHTDDLQKCISSILNKSSYKNFEIIIVENNSENEETFKYYKKFDRKNNIKVVKYEGGFNYSLINNFALPYCSGEYILLLNNDVEVITPKWLQEMLMFAQRDDVGAVGAKLLYPDDTIQHAGVILGINGVAGHAHKGWVKDLGGYAGRITLAQNLSAVTAACLMMRKSVFEQIDGFDPTFAVAFNDIDFCLRIRQAGYNIVYTPYAQLYHYESKSRGYEDTPEKKKRFMNEVLTFQKKWKDVLANGDPYYNKNLTLKYEDFSIKI